MIFKNFVIVVYCCACLCIVAIVSNTAVEEQGERRTSSEHSRSLDKTTETGTNAESTDNANHPAWKYLDQFECGESAADRIIGGKNAALGQFPWIVRLGYTYGEDNTVDWLCGGALISDRHVVTAAHCTETGDDRKLSKIRMGELDIRTDPDCVLDVCATPVQDRNLKTVTSHPKFNTPAFQNDIAIIELAQPVDLNNYVSPICLPRHQLEDFKLGDLVIAAGFGRFNMTTEDSATILQTVALPIVALQSCSSITPKGFEFTPAIICAGAQLNKDACAGDSGGPLMKVSDTPEGPKNYLVGVVSFGPVSCGSQRPGVYSSVAYFLNWILDNII